MRTIAIVTERRADYSRFKPILELIREDPELDYKLIVTGISLLREHGNDIDVIRRDGFEIEAVVPMFLENAPDTGAEMVRAMGRVLPELTRLFERIRPDIVLTGFDIGANFAATVAGAHMNIPVAHIQGGEVTGSIDESLRHAMSKFAHLHFPATEDAARRLIRMGEDPRYVFTVGCPSLDVVLRTSVIPKAEVLSAHGIDPARPYVIILQHPVTTEVEMAGEQMNETLAAVRGLDLQGILIYPNNDAGAQQVILQIQRSRITVVRSLPPEDFVNLVRYASALVGNSSSGIHETASLGVPTVNIGTRQQGRERGPNVLDVRNQRDEIRQAIRAALYDEEFKSRVAERVNPYGDGRSAQRIVRILKTVSLDHLIQKRFYDGTDENCPDRGDGIHWPALA
ncbi:MAG: UDP-N-acetylglucosamine 2-epimerase (hydrolyzing) [Nitrospirae bacterium]|nr:UDP-N-acetylglucosamine 2-epimerase (hydrolyzing) [Nitrospirota bacterium]